MVEWLKFSLRAWDRRDREITAAEFLHRLRIAPGDPVAVERGPGVPACGCWRWRRRTSPTSI